MFFNDIVQPTSSKILLWENLLQIPVSSSRRQVLHFFSISPSSVYTSKPEVIFFDNKNPKKSKNSAIMDENFSKRLSLLRWENPTLKSTLELFYWTKDDCRVSKEYQKGFISVWQNVYFSPFRHSIIYILIFKFKQLLRCRMFLLGVQCSIDETHYHFSD